MRIVMTHLFTHRESFNHQKSNEHNQNVSDESEKKLKSSEDLFPVTILIAAYDDGYDYD